MRTLTAILILSACACASAAVPPATWNEVGASVTAVIQATRLGDEALIDILSAALEVEKKATVPHRADGIAANIRKGAQLSAADFSTLRRKHSFFDLAIGCAMSRVRKMPMVAVLQERELGVWQEILPRFLKEHPSAAPSLVAEIEKLLK